MLVIGLLLLSSWAPTKGQQDVHDGTDHASYLLSLADTLVQTQRTLLPGKLSLHCACD